MAGIHSVNILIHFNFQIDEIVHLRMKCVIQLLKCGKSTRITRLNTHPLSRHRIHTVIERELQYLRHIQIAGKQVSLLPESTYLDATATASFTCILQRFTGTQHLLDVDIGIEDRWITMPLAYHPDGGMQETIGCDGGDMYRVTRLKYMQLLNHLQHQVGDLVHPIRSVGFHSSYINVGKVVISAALTGCDAHLGWGRLIVHLDPEAAQQLLRLLPCQGTLFQVVLIERSQMLVKMSGIKSIPSVKFSDHSQMDEPVHLYGFPIVTGRMCRHPATHLSNTL